MTTGPYPQSIPRWPIVFAAAFLAASVAPVLHASERVQAASPPQLAMMDEMDMEPGMPPDDTGDAMGGSMPPKMGAGARGGMRRPMGPPMTGLPGPESVMGTVGGRGSSGGSPQSAPRSNLPGFPGASHLYHLGASDFFLDHPQHITLSMEQRTALNRIKERALLDQASFDGRIADAEQELWKLTAADVPDAGRIDAQVRSIEKIRGDKRMSLIRAVGEAAKVLTPDQQGALLGTLPAAGEPPATGGITGKPRKPHM